MAEKTPASKKRLIDPNFFIPDGVTTFEFTELGDEDSAELEARSNDEAELGEVSLEDSDLDEDSDDTPDAPQIYGILSQVIRTAPDGSQVVDVVLDVDDLNVGEEYDVRITAT